MDINQHQKEILENHARWVKKPILQDIYHHFHEEIAKHLSGLDSPLIVELGSGIGNIKEVIPNCLRTDLFPNPWLDQIENAYKLSFADESVSDLILFDVFHHLRYPGTALKELMRVLRPGGRVIIFDPFISLLGLIVYGGFHKEPVDWGHDIQWFAPKGWKAEDADYYAAQGNGTRIFFGRMAPTLLKEWKVILKLRFAAISYAACGGYSGPQLYPDFLYPFMRFVDNICNLVPPFFATRLLVVLEKPSDRN